MLKESFSCPASQKTRTKFDAGSRLSFPVSPYGELLSPGGPVCPCQACSHLLWRCPEKQYLRSAWPSLMCFWAGWGVEVLNWKNLRREKLLSLSRWSRPLGAAGASDSRVPKVLWLGCGGSFLALPMGITDELAFPSSRPWKGQLQWLCEKLHMEQVLCLRVAVARRSYWFHTGRRGLRTVAFLTGVPWGRTR